MLSFWHGVQALAVFFLMLLCRTHFTAADMLFITQFHFLAG